MALYKRNSGDIWWFKFQWRGRCIQQSTKTTNKRAAGDIEAAYRLRLARGDAGIPDAETAPTLEDFADRFRRHYKAHAKKPLMIRFYDQNLKQILAYKPLASARIDTIDSRLIAKFVELRRAGVRRRKPQGVEMIKPVTNATINRALATLRRMMKLGEEWGTITKAPKIAMLPGERSREFVLTPDDEPRYFAACNPRLAKIAKLSLLTSLRANECRTLRWDDVHMRGAGAVDRAFIKVRSDVAKSSKGRIVPLSAAALAFLQQQSHLDELVLGKKFPQLTAVARSQGRVRAKLGMPADFVVHSMRHTALTRMGESGMDAFALQAIAGHASITTTMKYVHPVPEHLARSMDRIDALAQVAVMPQKKRA